MKASKGESLLENRHNGGRIFANPHRHAAWGGNAYNLAAVASAWILADSLAARRAQREPAVSSPLAEVS